MQLDYSSQQSLVMFKMLLICLAGIIITNMSDM